MANMHPALADYPDVGATPTPMWGTTFRYQDPLSGAAFNPDGTNSSNPVVSAGSQTVNSVNYLLKSLKSSSTISFKGQNYTVYSAVPQNLTIDYAYKNASQYYDPNSLTPPGSATPLIDFTIPTTINGGNSTTVASQPPSTPQVSPYTKDNVYLATAPTDANSRFFIPNLPNSPGKNDGLTANIYFVADPFIGKPGYWPDTSTFPNGTFHLTPYGWALDPRTVAQSYTVQLLDATGGASTGTSVTQATAILMNMWKHTIQGYDMTSSDPTNHPADPAYFTVQRDLLAPFFAAVKSDATYPFPGKNSQSGNYPAWINNGIFLHVQPQPGFQRNLLRYYTAWGAIDLYNQASDLFVRSDGTIELPAVLVDQIWQYVPIVTQTWDGSQRYTVLNLTTGTVPSTYDDYPGAEYYLPGNVYLPGTAGVIQAYVDYLVYGNVGLVARQTDLWMGLKGDTVNDMLFWASAPVSGQPTEPGGMANKPYMFGASTYKDATNTWHYSIRLQSSNSFCVARLAPADLQNKLFDASLYVSGPKGYLKAATISYQWQNFTLDSTANSPAGKWVASNGALGAGVPQLTFADTLHGTVAIQAAPSTGWSDSSRVLTYGTQQNVDLGNLTAVANTIGSNIYEYFATSDSMNANTQFLIVLNERQDWQGSSGSWSTAGNWVSGSVPAAFNNVYLEQNDNVSRTVTYNNTSPTAPSLAMLRLNATGTGTMTLQVDTASPTGNLDAEMAVVGASGQGAILQTAGNVTLSDKLYLGYGSTANGTYTLQNGILNTSSALVGVYGTGTFNQSGGTVTIGDTLTLAANSGSTGTYNISGGTLNVGKIITNTGGTLNNTGGMVNPQQVSLQGGNFISDLENRSILAGYGTITGRLTNSGTISPGNSPGTINVVGSYTQTPNGAYIAEIASPSSYDRIAVTGIPGTANLAGTISPVLLGGYRPPGNTEFPGVVSATGGITGSFSLTNRVIGPTLFWQPRYTANSFDLVVQRDYANPGLGLNSNQLAVGTMLNRVAGTTFGDLNTVLNAIDSLPMAASVQEAYKQISPEKAGALANLGFGAANFQVRNLASRTTNRRFGQGGSGGADSLPPGRLSCNYSRQSGVMLAYNGGFLPDLFAARKEFKAPESRWGLFADGGAAFGSQNSTSNQTGYNFTLAGLTLGADYRLTDQLLVGLATGYSNTASGFYGTGGSVNVNTIPVNAYAAYFSGSLYAYGSLGYALNLYSLKRGLNFDGIGRTATSSTTGNQFNLYGEAGYDVKLSRMILTPAATLAYSALWLGSFTEQDAGALNLRVGAQNASSVQTGLGGRVTVPLKIGRVLVVPQAYAFYQHEFANSSRGLTASLSQGSGTFTWQTDAPGQNFALVGASLTAGLKNNLYAQVNYNAEVGRRNTTAQFINAGLRYEF
jgi:uncharacterized protein with beta-barrel porin domain